MIRSITRSVDGVEKNCYTDFGWFVSAIKLSPPKKKKVFETVPYRSGSYDFSTLYGEQTYEDREMTITFSKELPVTRDDGQLWEFINWLYAGGRTRMWEKTDEGSEWFYNAECTAVDIGDGLEIIQDVTATFIADPFRYSPRPDTPPALMTDEENRKVYIVAKGAYLDRMVTVRIFGPAAANIWITKNDPTALPPWDAPPDYKAVAGGVTFAMAADQLYVAIESLAPWLEDEITVTDRSI